MKHTITLMALAAATLVAAHAQQTTPPPAQFEEKPPASDTLTPEQIEKRVTEIVEAVTPKVEEVARAVEKAVEQVGRKFENFHFDAAPAQAHPPRGKGYSSNDHPHDEDEEDGRFLMNMFGGPRQPRALVVRTSPMDAKAAEALQEDITVMGRILEKNIEGKGNAEAMGIGVWALEGVIRRPVRNMYIEGHGVIFMMEAPFALLAPPTEKETKEPKEETSSDWEEARRELYGQNRRGGMFALSPAKGAPYNEAKVERLTERLIESLKNATHMKSLKADEHVTVVVSGPKASSSLSEVSVVDPSGGNKSDVRVEARAMLVKGEGRGESSTLTIRARKGDIDDFAKNKLSLEDFRKKVKVASY